MEDRASGANSATVTTTTPPPSAEPRLDAIERELAEFSYIVSHDLAGAFRLVSGFSDVLMMDLGEKLSDQQRGYADRISTASEKCQAMLEQLLVYSRIQQAGLDFAECDASLLVDAARLQLGREIAETGAAIEVEPLGAVSVDQTLFTAAFKRVLDNAVKFRRPGVPPRIRVALAGDAEHWAVRIFDNGMGVPAAEREKLFRMFYRLRPEAPDAGLGAGLPIARRILRRHDGDVRFIECEEGACVELSLPAAHSPARCAA